MIQIEDTGIGIKKDKISYLFNKFYTANEYGNATSGAGLRSKYCKEHCRYAQRYYKD